MSSSTSDSELTRRAATTLQHIPCLDAQFDGSTLVEPDAVRLANEIVALANAGGGVFAVQVGTGASHGINEIVDRLDAVQSLVVVACDHHIRPFLPASTTKHFLDAEGNARPVVLKVTVEPTGLERRGPGGPRLCDGRQRFVTLPAKSR